MRKTFKGLMLLLSVGMTMGVQAAIPEGYYDDAVGKSGSALQAELADIISHSDPGYSNLWTIYKTTDRRADGKVWDMYSNTTDFTFGSDQCGNYSGEGDCYNREHTIPKSWRDGSNYSDVHIVVPTDGFVNSKRGNFPFGEVSSSSYVSDNSFSKVGTCKTSGYSGTVFEPNDEYKGDFARIYFYAATRYYNECGSWGGDGFSGSFPYLDEWTRVMMLRWHELDPVSQKEIDRNDAIYETSQRNRNPFVDYPELVDLIFGNHTTTPFNPEGSLSSAYLESPTNGYELAMGTTSLGADNVVLTKQLRVKGVDVEENLTLTLTGSSYFTISTTTITADQANAGYDVTVTYAPLASGAHAATLVISGGIRNDVTVNISGSAVEGFAALAPTNVDDTSFQANWIKHSQADDYELSVWRVVCSGSEAQLLFDVNFGEGLPSGWSTVGYTNVENSAIRLASGSNDGTVVTPSLNLSATSTLTVTCSPYRTSDQSVLYILVDGEEVAQVDCAASEVTETINLDAATQHSIISFKASKSHRVYLQSAQLTTGGGLVTENLDGYPRRVGDVSSYTVEGVEALKEYRYKVTAYDGDSKIEESNTVVFTTGSTSIVDAVEDVPQGAFVYAYQGKIYIDAAPANAQVRCYALDGTLADARTLHAQREVLSPAGKGIYVIQIITQEGSYTTKVMVY